MVIARFVVALVLLAAGYGFVRAGGSTNAELWTFEMPSLPCAFKISVYDFRLTGTAGDHALSLSPHFERRNIGLYSCDSEPFVVTRDRNIVDLGYDLSVYVNRAKATPSETRLISKQQPSGAALLRFAIVDAKSDEVLVRDIKGSDLRLRGEIARRDTLEQRNIHIRLAEFEGRTVRLRAEIVCTSLADKLPSIRKSMSGKLPTVD